MKRYVLLGVAGIAVLATGFALAEDRHGRQGAGQRPGLQMFATLDADGDGKITKAEIAEHQEAQFAERDLDGDGSISKEELVAAMASKMQARMGQMADRMLEKQDANGDGVINPGEMTGNRLADMFDRLDADGDGAISIEEMAAHDGKRGGQFGGEHNGDEMGGHSGMKHNH